MTETGKDEYTSDEVVVYGEQLYSERPSQESVELDTLSSGTGSMADADLIITKEDGANAWVKKTASKLWDYIKGKIGISNGGSANKFLNERGTFTVVNSGKVYDVEMDSTNENMTLTEDDTDKTELPLVTVWTKTRAEWDLLSAAEKAKYRVMHFPKTDPSSHVLQSHIGQIVESTTLDSLTKVREVYGYNTTWIQHTGYLLKGASSGVTAGSQGQQKDGGLNTHELTISEMPSHTHTQNSHNHTQNSHNHTQNAHSHYLFNNVSSGTFGSTYAAVLGSQANYIYYIQGSTGAPNVYQAQSTTATNVANTATNIAQTATNQNTGGGTANVKGASFSVQNEYKNIYIWERIA